MENMLVVWVTWRGCTPGGCRRCPAPRPPWRGAPGRAGRAGRRRARSRARHPPLDMAGPFIQPVTLLSVRPSAQPSNRPTVQPTDRLPVRHSFSLSVTTPMARLPRMVQDIPSSTQSKRLPLSSIEFLNSQVVRALHL